MCDKLIYWRCLSVDKCKSGLSQRTIFVLAFPVVLESVYFKSQ